jgi:hypothetical protein
MDLRAMQTYVERMNMFYELEREELVNELRHIWWGVELILRDKDRRKEEYAESDWKLFDAQEIAKSRLDQMNEKLLPE